MITLSLLIFFLPVVSFLFLMFFSRSLFRKGDYIGIASMSFAWLISIYLFARMMTSAIPFILNLPWIGFNLPSQNFPPLES